MNWTVHLADEAAKQLKAIPPDRRKRIVDDILELADDPFRGLVKPLKGRDSKASTGRRPAGTESFSSRSTPLARFRFCSFCSAMSGRTVELSRGLDESALLILFPFAG